MIVRGYTLDLYCDNQKLCNNRAVSNYGETGRGQFVGETYRQCAKEAMREGWIIRKKDGICYCPACRAKAKED